MTEESARLRAAREAAAVRHEQRIKSAKERRQVNDLGPAHAADLADRLFDLDRALEKVRAEAVAAIQKYPKLNSPHEGLGVLTEEFVEFFLEVWKNQRTASKHEAMQLAAVALRYMAEIQG